MESHLEEIRNQQRETWNRSAPGWRKYDELMVAFLKPLCEVMLRELAPKPDAFVLDVAAGTGEPGLTLAERIPQGRVLCTDLSEGMLDVAKWNAKRRGITNMETMVCDVTELPFADNSFDAVCCRLGFMFFPDMQRAANEMARVLKPGGRIATAVWAGPEENPWITKTYGALKAHIPMPPPTAGAPGLFRCAEPGMMVEMFRKAGLKQINEQVVTSTLDVWTFEPYWHFMTEAVGPVIEMLKKTDEATRNVIRDEVRDTLSREFRSGELAIPSSGIVIWAEK